ncbi:MAG: hypothetical protein PHU44_14375 [Syntrophales bacterium]|nr:hypothetical protein [Syntrophales bacterium]MDD5640892.1 hypothetical protein [Syntrophales bacterium]
MNTVAGVMLLLWVGGWTLAMLRAGLKARMAVALAPVPVKELPGKTALVSR